MADYLISTDFEVKTDKALRALDQLEKKIDQIKAKMKGDFDLNGFGRGFGVGGGYGGRGGGGGRGRGGGGMFYDAEFVEDNALMRRRPRAPIQLASHLSSYPSAEMMIGARFGEESAKLLKPFTKLSQMGAQLEASFQGFKTSMQAFGSKVVDAVPSLNKFVIALTTAVAAIGRVAEDIAVKGVMAVDHNLEMQNKLTAINIAAFNRPLPSKNKADLFETRGFNAKNTATQGFNFQTLRSGFASGKLSSGEFASYDAGDMRELARMEMDKLRRISLSMGVPLKDAVGTYEKNALLLQDMGKFSAAQVTAFTDLVLKSQNVLTAGTAASVVQRELGNLFSGHAKTQFPLFYRDVVPKGQEALAARPDIMKKVFPKGGQIDTKRFNAMGWEDRQYLIMAVLGMLGGNQPTTNLNTIEGQKNNLETSWGMASETAFAPLQAYFVDFFKQIGDSLRSGDTQALLSQFAGHIQDFANTVHRVVDSFNETLTGRANTSGTWDETIKNSIESLGKLVDALGKFAIMAGKVAEFIAHPAQFAFNHSIFGKDYSNSSFGVGMVQEILHPEGTPDPNAAIPLYLRDPNFFLHQSKAAQAFFEKQEGKPADSKLDIKQTNHITVSLESNLPPDLIAQTMADALRKSVMLPSSSVKVMNSHAMAR